MKYMGSKNRIAKEILPIILDGKTDDQWYVEPFCGGCNIIDKVIGKRIASDVHTYLIAMWKELQNKWIPPDYVSFNEYQGIKNDKDKYPDNLVGYVGFNSYGGKWFGGYCRDSQGKRDYWREHKSNIMKQIPNLMDVKFYCDHYYSINIPKNSVVYCDPPYKGTTKYSSGFDHDIFWSWVRHLSVENTVFVSEYTAPADFKSVWQKSVNNTLVQNTGAKRGTEHLFVIN